MDLKWRSLSWWMPRLVLVPCPLSWQHSIVCTLLKMKHFRALLKNFTTHFVCSKKISVKYFNLNISKNCKILIDCLVWFQWGGTPLLSQCSLLPPTPPRSPRRNSSCISPPIQRNLRTLSHSSTSTPRISHWQRVITTAFNLNTAEGLKLMNKF